MTENTNALVLKSFVDALNEASAVTFRGKHSQNDFVLVGEDIDVLKAAIENRLENVYHARDFKSVLIKPKQAPEPNTRESLMIPGARVESKPLGPVSMLIFWSIMFALFAGLVYSVNDVAHWAATHHVG